MTIEESFESVKHTNIECPVCSVCDYAHLEPPRGVLARFWYSTWGIWSLVVLMLVLAYVLAIHEIYNIVGGLQ